VTALGWTFMLTSLSLVIGLCAFCFLRVLASHVVPPDEEQETDPENSERPIS
jgi:hypothetical protein